MKKETMFVKERVLLLAGQEKVWDLLLNPKYTVQYMFGCELVSDWKVGSTVSWNTKSEDGQVITLVEGHVIEFIEGSKVVFTTFDPHSGMDNIPANHVTLTYETEVQGSSTLLKITQGDFAKVVDGEKRYLESQQGWTQVVLPLMQELLSNLE